MCRPPVKISILPHPKVPSAGAGGEKCTTTRGVFPPRLLDPNLTRKGGMTLVKREMNSLAVFVYRDFAVCLTRLYSRQSHGRRPDISERDDLIGDLFLFGNAVAQPCRGDRVPVSAEVLSAPVRVRTECSISEPLLSSVNFLYLGAPRRFRRASAGLGPFRKGGWLYACSPPGRQNRNPASLEFRKVVERTA